MATRTKRSGRKERANTTSTPAFCAAHCRLHSIAVGNLLPAAVKVACVDISPATVTKLMDRGSTQTVGIVSDAEPFIRALVNELDRPAK